MKCSSNWSRPTTKTWSWVESRIAPLIRKADSIKLVSFNNDIMMTQAGRSKSLISVYVDPGVVAFQ
eukprot:6902972-Ditylum_brightwellii.AAC.1